MLFILYNLKTYKPERTHKTLCVCVCMWEDLGLVGGGKE